MSRPTAPAALAVLAVFAASAGLLAGCASKPAVAAPKPVALPAPLATSLSDAAGTSWAAVVMGGSAKQHNNFWELFVRARGAADWTEVTPPGIADNGGMVLASPAPQSVLVGFRASQGLTFSPLTSSTDDGTHWSPGALVSPGLADQPDALAAGPGDSLLALSGDGRVQLGSRLGARWSSLTSEQSVGRSAPGRDCGLTGLTAVAFSPAGQPMLAGDCTKAGKVGILARSGGSWRLSGPVLPASLGAGGTSVLRLATTGTTTSALIAIRSGKSVGLVAAWSSDGGANWSVSAELPGPSAALQSAAFWPGGAVAVVLAGGRGAVLASPGAAWRKLPALPARTATLAQGPGGRLDAIAAGISSSSALGSTMTAWQLDRSGWQRIQTVRVDVPYGSSS
jgi:hypothetical protein